jgi:hypothetical protein
MADTFDDPVLGHLEWDDQLNCWSGGVDLTPDFHAEFTVSATEEDRFLGIAAARVSLAWLKAHEPEARAQVAAEMVELYNDCWTDEGEISAEVFAQRIELNRASFGADGSVMLSYDDGPTSMFGGHLLDAFFGPDKAYRETHMIG